MILGHNLLHAKLPRYLLQSRLTTTTKKKVGEVSYLLRPAYLLENSNTNQTTVWYLNNNVRVGSAWGPTLPNGWFLVGAADFNRDGHPDYVLQAGAGITAIAYLSGTTLTGAAWGPTIPPEQRHCCENRSICIRLLSEEAIIL